MGAKAQPEADERKHPEQREQRQRSGQHEGLARAGRGREERQGGADRQEDAPDECEHRNEAADGDQERTAAGRGPPADERRRSDQRRGEHAGREAGPGLRGPQRRSAEHGNDGEDERSPRGGREAGAEQEVEPAPFDAEPHTGENGDDPAGERDRGVEHEPDLGQEVGVLQLRITEEQRRRGAEQRDEQDLSQQPRAVDVARGPLHVPLIGRHEPADEGQRCPSASSSPTTTR